MGDRAESTHCLCLRHSPTFFLPFQPKGSRGPMVILFYHRASVALVLLCVIPPSIEYIVISLAHVLTVTRAHHIVGLCPRTITPTNTMPYPYFGHDPPLVRTLTQILVSNFHDFATNINFTLKNNGFVLSSSSRHSIQIFVTID